MDYLRRAGGIFHPRPYARFVLRKTFEFGSPENVSAVAPHVVVKNLLILVLLQDEHVWVSAQPSTDVRQVNFAAHLAAFEQADFAGNRALLDGLLRHAHLLVNLQRAGVHAEGLR